MTTAIRGVTGPRFVSDVVAAACGNWPELLAAARQAILDPAMAAQWLQVQGRALSAGQRDWLWGSIGRQAALNLDLQATGYFSRAGSLRHFDEEHLEWMARNALRHGQWAQVQKAIEAPGQRGLVQDTGVRKLVRSVVNPCQLGQMAETHLLIEPHWQSHFSQCHARDGGGPITVAKLRQWIDMPKPMGLPLELQNLVILAFAASTSRRFTMRGGPFEPSVDSMPDELELREQSLPNTVDWQIALQRASSLFGLTLGQTLNAANVGKLVDEVKQKVGERRDAVSRLVVQVRDRAGRYAAGTTGSRQQTAESAQSFLAAVASAADSELVTTLAGEDLQTSEAAVGRALGQAKVCADVLELGSYWQLFDVVLKLNDHRAEAAQVIGRRLAEVLISDEHVLGLKGRLDELHRDAMTLLAAAAPVPAPVAAAMPSPGVPAPAPVAIPPVPANLAPEVVAEKQQLHLMGAEAVAALEELKARITSERDLELTLSWRLQRKGTQL